jgi:hypothetical protein
MTLERERKIDALGHRRGCLYFDDKAAPSADPNNQYVDLFCDCHENDMPEIGANGTDVVWPADWTEQEAMVWRRRNSILRDSGGDTPWPVSSAGGEFAAGPDRGRPAAAALRIDRDSPGAWERTTPDKPSGADLLRFDELIYGGHGRSHR